MPVTHAWSGVIGYTLDALPVIGRDRERPALVYALGWCGHGLALSVASGAWIARLVFEDRAGSTGAWFRDRSPRCPARRCAGCRSAPRSAAMAVLDRVA